MPHEVTSSLADALPLFLYSGGCLAAVVVLFGRCFATRLMLRACSPLVSLATVFFVGPSLGVALFGWLVWSAPLRVSSAVHLLCYWLRLFRVFVCTFSSIFLYP